MYRDLQSCQSTMITSFEDGRLAKLLSVVHDLGTEISRAEALRHKRASALNPATDY
jgi:hypothetical protein